MKRDIHAECSALLDELQDAVEEYDPYGLRSDRIRVIRFRIGQLLHKQMIRDGHRLGSLDRRTGPDALN